MRLARPLSCLATLCVSLSLLLSTTDGAVVPKTLHITLPERGSVDVHYLEAGERETGQPTVMFLHGAKFSAADWQAAGTFDALAKLPMHAVAPDVPGFGQTGGAKLAKAAERLAFMVEFLDKLGIYQVLLVAASMGGSYAMPYIVHEPSSVVGFVPIGAIGSEDYMTQLHAMPDRLAFPVLVIWGELDHPEGPRCKYYEWLFPNSRTEVFAGAHHPCWHEFPDKFNSLLVGFLREQESLGWTAGDSAEHTHTHRASVREL